MRDRQVDARLKGPDRRGFRA